MKVVLTLLLWCALGAPALAQDNGSGGREAERLARTFAGAFIERDSESAVSVMHPALSKLGVWPNLRGSGRDGVLALPPGSLDILSGWHNHDGRLDSARVSVDVLDSTADVGVVRLTVGDDWYDYYLAARVGGVWRIVNGVFGAASDLSVLISDTETQAALRAARAYAASIAHGELVGTHLDFTRRTTNQAGGPLIVEMRDAFTSTALRHGGGAANLSLLAIAPTTAVVRIESSAITEWLLMLKLDGVWRPVSSFWMQR